MIEKKPARSLLAIERKTAAVALVGFLALMTTGGLTRHGYGLLLPEMRRALELTYAQTGLIATAFFGGYMVLTLAGSIAVARFGPPLLVSITVPVVGVAMLAMGTTGSFGLALAAYALAGCGAGTALVAATTLPGRWVSTANRGKVAGFIVGGIAMGQLATGLVLPGLVQQDPGDGWRWGWFLLGGFTLLAALVSTLGLRAVPPGPGGPAQTSRWAGARQLLGRSPALWWLTLEGLFEGISYVTFSVFFAAYLSGERQLPLGLTGQLWMLNGTLALVGGFLWAGASDRIDRRVAMAAAVLTRGASYLVFAFSTDVTGYLVAVVLHGSIGAVGLAIMSALCVDHFGARLAPAAVGIANFGFAIGQVLAPGFAGLVADATGSFALPLYLSATCSGLAAVSALLIPRAPRPSPEPART